MKMDYLKSLFILTVGIMSATCFLSCIKPTENKTPPGADQVLGLYIHEVPNTSPPALERVETYKIANNKYGLRKLSTARFPNFDFTVDTSAASAIGGALLRTQYYLILPQTKDGITLVDTGHLSYKIDKRYLSFNLKDPGTGGRIDFTATKQ
jgi:hypothetical protein